jgi:hypothetical protein
VNHHALLNYCNLKLQLYCRHRIQVLAQRKAIDELLQRLPSDQAHITMDFKMMFEAIFYYREKTLDFYGKKGLSWHGGMIYHRYTDDEKVSIRTTTKNHNNFTSNIMIILYLPAIPYGILPLFLHTLEQHAFVSQRTMRT